jgi:signal transduction histidine kinase
MHSIAEALSRGEARFLDGIRHKTQVETLDAVLNLAKWARIRSYQRQANESSLRHGQRIDHIQQQPIGPESVRFAEYPFPHLYKRHLQELIAQGQNTKGVKQAAEKMLKRLAREKEEYVTFQAEHDIESLSDFLERAKTTGLDVEQVTASMQNFKRLQRANIADVHELRAALREYLTHRAAARGDDPVKVAERELIGKDLPGFFPTPRPVIDRMLELARIESQHKVLEPSCGKGDILDALREACSGVEPHAIERNYTLSDVLSAKGYAVQFCDFLEHRREYDRIVMNPPFESGQDIEHVRHAYSLLSPGGRLVSVVCEGPFFRVDNKSVKFRDWLEEVHAEVEKLPEDAFQGREAFRETGVRTRLVAIQRP